MSAKDERRLRSLTQPRVVPLMIGSTRSGSSKLVVAHLM